MVDGISPIAPKDPFISQLLIGVCALDHIDAYAVVVLGIVLIGCPGSTRSLGAVVVSARVIAATVVTASYIK